MFRWSVVFLVLAAIAAFLGFVGLPAAVAGTGKVLFVVFLALFFVMLAGNFLSHRVRPPH